MTKSLLAAALVFTSTLASSFAAIVARYDFEDGVVPSASVDTELTSTASTFQSGPGLSLNASTVGDFSSNPFTTSSLTGDVNGSADGAIFAASGANQTTQEGAVTNNDYLTFTLTPNAGYSYSFTQLDFKLAQSGPKYAEGYFIRSSVTGTTNLDSGTFNTSLSADGTFQLISVNLSGVTLLQNVTTATTFQIFFYNPDGGALNNSDRIDKVQLSADISPIPEPSTYAMIGLGGLLLAAAMRVRHKTA